MDSIKKIFLGLSLISVGILSAQELEMAGTAIKHACKPTESITGNFLAAVPNFIHGFHGLGLGFSRLTLDLSQRCAGAGRFCANHYILSGSTVAAGLFFYKYIWPNIVIDVSYSNHRLIHIHPHVVRR